MTQSQRTLQQPRETDAYVKRSVGFVRGSPVVSLCFSPPHGIFQTDKLIPPFFEFNFQFTRTKDEVFFLAPADPGLRVKMLDMRIETSYIEMNPKVVSAHQAQLAQGDLCTIPFKAVKVKSKVFATGLKKFDWNNVIQGQLPEAIYFAMLNSTASTGDYKLNPYNFQPYNNTELYIKINGTQVPGSSFKSDYEKPYGFTRIYKWLYDNIGVFDNSSTHVTMDQFKDGCHIVALDNSPHRCQNLCNHSMSSGSLDFYVELKAVTRHPVEVIAFATYNQFIHIDKNAKVTLTQGT